MPEGGIPVISGKENPVYQLALIALYSRWPQLYTWPESALYLARISQNESTVAERKASRLAVGPALRVNSNEINC